MRQSDDLVIEGLAAALLEAEASAMLYREIVQAALEQLHEAEDQRRAQQYQLQRLREELRRYTAAQVAP